MRQERLHLPCSVQVDMGHDPQLRLPLGSRGQDLDQVGVLHGADAHHEPDPRALPHGLLQRVDLIIATGQNNLRSLAEAGVGALYLGRVATPFSLRDTQQATLGEVRSSGVYLRADGQAGVLQQIDLSA